ncbi:unnamed protein product [Heligmosomoides polygyrus]|uniref:Reverse transcriptase domain-containing protein n=1 Tax=Heligmosomoides polygyrus TaxID=6339 RepID=A0A183G3X5_HELPZ|nr:unnamed protein product [Heligmosomoides polygyrus]
MDALTWNLQKPALWTLLCADDVMLACGDKGDLEWQVQAWCDRLARFGLKLQLKKTEYLMTDANESGSIKINGTELARLRLVQVRSLTGMLCDRKIPEHLKSKIYRTVVRTVAMYCVECW